MQQLSLLHLFSQLASLICTVLITSFFLALLALCMQQRLFRTSRFVRALVGVVISAAMLIASPLLVYRRPRQHMAIGLATMSYMAALTVLDWCLLQPADSAPSVRAVLSSFVWQSMSGIISAYNAKQKALAARSAAQHAVSGSSKGAAPEHQPQQQQQTTSQLLLETCSALLHLMVLMDIVSAILECCFCYGEMSALHLDSTGMGEGVAATAAAYLVKAVAGFLLGMQLAATHMMGRVALLFVGYSDVGPVYIFDKPWMATSISDLWSNRWHQVLRYYFTGLGYSLADWLSAALLQLLSGLGCSGNAASSGKQGTNNSKGFDSSGSSSSMGRQGTAAGSANSRHQSVVQQGWQREVKRAIRTLVVFAISGVVHEYVVWAAFGVVSGKHLAFFMLHGCAVLAEGLAGKAVENSSLYGTLHVPMWLRRAWVLSFALMTCPLFVDVLLQHRHYQNYVPPFIAPVTTVVMENLGLCHCT